MRSFIVVSKKGHRSILSRITDKGKKLIGSKVVDYSTIQAQSITKLSKLSKEKNISKNFYLGGYFRCFGVILTLFPHHIITTTTFRV